MDATSLEQQPLAGAVAPELSASGATRVIPSYDDPSVHEEKTVIGQVPRELLEAERQLAQATLPSPAAAPSAPTVMPDEAPERAQNETGEKRGGVWLWLLGAALVLLAAFWLLRQP